MTYLKIIGDVHGHITQYKDIAQKAKYSIQVGDLGFDYSGLSDLDFNHHKVLGGNHDNYFEVDGAFIKQTPHFLGDFGTFAVPEVGEFFFVRGGRSIDKEYRVEGVTWFPQEELSYAQSMMAFDAYCEKKPDFMVTHECPSSIIDKISWFKTWNGQVITPSATANLLEQMLLQHRPKLWIFGHHHSSFDQTIDSCRFVCLEPLECFNFELKMNE